MAKVDFRIIKAWPNADDRNRPNLNYQLADADGNTVGIFVTPINSQLARMLRPDLEREEPDTAGEDVDWQAMEGRYYQEDNSD